MDIMGRSQVCIGCCYAGAGAAQKGSCARAKGFRHATRRPSCRAYGFTWWPSLVRRLYNIVITIFFLPYRHKYYIRTR